MALRNIVVVALASIAYAQQQTLYGQCGGIDYSGPTRCATTPTYATCQSVNPWYYQCTPAPTSTASVSQTKLPQTSTTKSLSSASTVHPTSTTAIPQSKRVSFAGVNIAGCDFGCDTSGNCNGMYCPTSVGPTQMQHFARDDKLNIFRLPVGWQYLVNYKLGGSLDPAFFATYDHLVQACLDTGAKCVVDVHNYARWYGGIIGQGGPSNMQFANLWSQIARKYAKQPNVVFGIMNEPHDLSMDAWATTVQAVVTAIRKAGAAKNWILLPGTGYSSAQAFVSDSAPYLSRIKNPNGSTTGLIYDVHRYYDGDGSGQSTECVTDHVQDTFTPLAAYLRSNKRKALLTETGGGNTQSCVTSVCSALSYLNQNNDVFLGWIGWAAGNFDQSYALSEVPDGNKDTLLVQQCIAGKFKR